MEDIKKLEIFHLAPYLPYGLKIQSPKGFIPNKPGRTEVDGIINLTPDLLADIANNAYEIHTKHFKPLLVSLSEWRNIEDGTQFLSPYFHQLEDMDGGIEANILSAPYADIQLLLIHHFDVFTLLKHGLAIDKRTVIEP